MTPMQDLLQVASWLFAVFSSVFALYTSTFILSSVLALWIIKKVVKVFRNIM